MALFVYITPECTHDAQTHQLTTEVEIFRLRVEQAQSTNMFDRFPAPYLVKKKLGGRQGRLIAQEHPLGEHAVIVFLAVMIRGHRDYESEFNRDPAEYAERHFKTCPDDVTLRKYVEERTRIEPPPAKPAPSDIECLFLYDTFSHRAAGHIEEMVSETREWVEQVGQERISRQLALLNEPCIEALKKDPGLHFIPVAGKRGWGIWAFRATGRVLFLTVSTDNNADDAERYARRVEARLGDRNEETILQESRRAYPALILADEDLWIDLEKESVANMALSPEESSVLESARSPQHRFPLFINGRAGSGKSTILQYLFADLLYFYLSKCNKEEMAPPIYLTANGELLGRARTFVERLLRGEAVFTQDTPEDLVTENRNVLDTAFREFQPHLLSLVPQDVRNSRFHRSARVDYARFRRMWMVRFGNEQKMLRDIGPDLSWHVIRSYIKGMSSETYLEPGDYTQLPQNQITVTFEAFDQVYQRVWEGWYRGLLESDHLWDDQDLARWVLNHDLVIPTHPAVVCDEAQDFTRLELELLLRLSLFSARTVNPADICHVPFAFAGDPFQTLNPTGFRWDSIKASFAEKFIFELDPAHRSGRVDLNYRELNYNYRSSRSIVRFGNQVQAMRAALFALPDVEPQTPWTVESNCPPVVWFRSNDASFWNAFRKSPGFVVIVPCNEGEEADFVRQDPILREQISIVDGVPVNVLSASRAKGCEYSSVVVYGFGASSARPLISELESGNDSGMLDPNESLPVQYFINRVYVAVSRPKRLLLIVDTDDGFAKLWRCAQDPSVEARMLRRIQNGENLWADQIEGMTMGSAETLTREKSPDPSENAESFEREGHARQDPFLLRQAAQAYRSAGNLSKARQCLASALESEGKYEEAGEGYLEAGLISDGVRCLWRAGRDGWRKLVQECSHYPEISDDLECRWARAVISGAEPAVVAEVLGSFAKRLEFDPEFCEACLGEDGWKDAIAAILRPALATKPAPSGQSIQWTLIAGAIDKIRAKLIPIPADLAAHTYFAAHRFQDAIALWAESGDDRSPEYNHAKALVEPYPERLLSLARIPGSTQAIIDAYRATPRVHLSPDQAAVVSDAFASQHRWQDAAAVAWASAAFAPMLRLAVASLRTGDKLTAVEALLASVALLVKQNQWEPIAGFLRSSDFIPAADWKDKELKKLVRDAEEAMKVTLVRAIARAEGLSSASQNSRDTIQDFLNRYLRVKEGKGGNWRGRLKIIEAGAAIERAGRFVHAISFYEAILKESSAEDRLFARQRWLVNKRRQADHERAEGNTGKVAQIEHDLQMTMDKLHITQLDDIEPLPLLPALRLEDVWLGTQPTPVVDRTVAPVPRPASPASAPALPERKESESVELTVGEFKLQFSRRLGRCNLTHLPTMDTAFIKTAEMRCGGEASFSRNESGSWTCDQWHLDIAFEYDGNSSSPGTLAIHLHSLGTEIRFRLTSGAEGTLVPTGAEAAAP